LHEPPHASTMRATPPRVSASLRSPHADGISPTEPPVRVPPSGPLQNVSCMVSESVRCRREIGAEGGTRTRMGLPTRPSNVRVYQFHHFGTGSAALWNAFQTLVNELISWVEFVTGSIDYFSLEILFTDRLIPFHLRSLLWPSLYLSCLPPPTKIKRRV
jgi:hypothetical protein